MFDNKSDSSKQKYLENLFIVLENQKEIAYREFSATDLNNGEGLNEINGWYTEIVNFIKKDPPVYHVRCLEITEDEQNHVVRIHYDYYRDNKKIALPSIIVQSILYDA